MNPIPSLPESGFVRLPTILALFPISKSAWWHGVSQGKYPKPVKLSARTTAWRVSDIRQLLDSFGKEENTEPGQKWRRSSVSKAGA